MRRPRDRRDRRNRRRETNLVREGDKLRCYMSKTIDNYHIAI